MTRFTFWRLLDRLRALSRDVGGNRRPISVVVVCPSCRRRSTVLSKWQVELNDHNYDSPELVVDPSTPLQP